MRREAWCKDNLRFLQAKIATLRGAYGGDGKYSAGGSMNFIRHLWKNGDYSMKTFKFFPYYFLQKL